MAKARETDQVISKTSESKKYNPDSNQNVEIERHPYALMVEDVFFRPHFAFESFVNQELIGGRDIWKIHLILSLLAPLSLIVQNVFKSILGFFLHKDPVLFMDFFAGSLKSWAFFIVMIVMVRFADLFRVYYIYWDRSKSWDPPTPWLLMISFLPFTASGIFFFFPIPINFLFVGIAFLYSLHLAYQAMQNISGYSNKDFLSYILQFMIFLTFCSAIVLGTYNVYRTVRG
jgi:hypothetical protein